ncbi:hypothetical protein CLI77_03530 [Porphyromonas gingivalis]|nr:hypothetical protein CS059_08280 [Porphyromonas gingivalis]PDP49917.1 hypothetical protein CLI77_03530 [Porphyromonas gingivalis]
MKRTLKLRQTTFRVLFTSLAHSFFSTGHAPKFPRLTLPKTWRENFLIVAREAKNLRATTKKLRFHFFRKLRPQLQIFWDVFPR